MSTLTILFVAPRVPKHLGSGDRLLALKLADGFVSRGHVVDIIGYDDSIPLLREIEADDVFRHVYTIPFSNVDLVRNSPWKQLKDFCQGMFRGIPRRVWEWYSSSFQSSLDELLNANHYDLIQCFEISMVPFLFDRKHRCLRYKVPVVCEFVDALSMSLFLSLRYRFDVSWPFRLIEAFQLRRYERNAVRHFAASTVVAQRDATMIGFPEKLTVIPLGVDLPLLQMQGQVTDIDLLFVANMSSRSNADAIRWFLRNVFPGIVSGRPETILYVVGHYPPDEIVRGQTKNIVVTGTVDDIGQYFRRAKIFIAPLRYGAGQKIKLLNACAYRMAIVATKEANYGVGIPDDAFIEADDPSSMTNAICTLLDHLSRRETLGEKAYAFVSGSYSWKQSVDQFLELYYDILHT